MKTARLLTAAPLLGLPLLLALRPTGQNLTFDPAEGTEVRSTFTSVMDFEMDDMTMLMNGEESPMMPSMEMVMAVTQTIGVADVYGAMKGGQPSRVQRTFDTITTAMDMDMSVEAMGQTQDQSMTGGGGSELEGKTVVFTLGDDGSYKASWPEGEDGDAELLNGLTEDMSLRNLVPGEEVAEGDTYEIPLEGLIDVLAPGGDLKLDVEIDGEKVGGAPDAEMMSDMRKMLGDMLEGQATGKLTGTRELDGDTLAVIALDIELDTQKDMAEMIFDLMGGEMPEGIDISLEKADIQFAMVGEGELVWNVTKGHAHELSLEGESSIVIDMAMGIDAGGQTMNMEMGMEMSGTMQYKVETR